jgi:hypothetical protein
VFDKGTVDFSPVRSIVPGPPGAEFPPQSAQPGAIGDKDYSPPVRVLNAGGVTYNAPVMAFGVGANEIIDGKLYLNYDKQVREDWRKDTKGRIQKADQNWPKLAGK